jgi:hypothetical protein
VLQFVRFNVILLGMSNDDLSKLLAEATDKIKREAYAAGWRDAITAVNKSVNEKADPAIPADLSLMSDGGGVQSQTPSTLKLGTTPYVVFQAINKQPGMSGTEIVNAVQEGGHKVSEGSIRTTVIRLKARRLIVARHGKWFTQPKA